MNNVERNLQGSDMADNKLWSDEEVQSLRDVHASGSSYKSMMHLWPGRTHRAVFNKAAYLELGPRPIPIKHDYSAVWEAILRELKNGEALGYAIADKIGTCRAWPPKLLRKNVESEDPKVHIANWVRSRPGGMWLEVWKLRKGMNAVKPQPMTMSQIKKQRRFMARLKSKRNNPFAAAAGLVSTPCGSTGRIYRQSMTVTQDEEETV